MAAPLWPVHLTMCVTILLALRRHEHCTLTGILAPAEHPFHALTPHAFSYPPVLISVPSAGNALADPHDGGCRGDAARGPRTQPIGPAPGAWILRCCYLRPGPNGAW
ncbi:hypothetical protein C8R46DRAFT_1209537 [Mycena filopes]|nr:hypothetical protein C8R46DRAFT_1209537 [Mycena filopes]